MNIKISKNDLTPEEYLYLRQEASWGSPDLHDIDIALKNTLVQFSARIEGKIAGIVRIVGDNRLCFYIQDVVVAIKYRKLGIDNLLVEEAMKYISENAAGNAFVGLMSAKGLEPLYRKFGFIDRPSKILGAGMTQFFGRPGQVTEE